MPVIGNLTLALFAVLAATAWMSWRERETGDHPFIIFVGGYYFMFHGALSWFTAANVDHLPYMRALSIGAPLYTIAFVLFQMAGYQIGKSVLPKPKPAATPARLAPLLLLSWGAAAFTLLFYIFPVMLTLPSLPQLKHPGWYFAIAILSYLAFDGRLSRLHIAAIAAMVVFKFFLDMVNGEVTHMLFSVVILLNAAFIFRRHGLALSCIVFCALVVSCYAYVKYFSRTIVLGDGTYIADFTPELSTNSLYASFSSMARRSSHGLLTNHVILLTPEWIGYDRRMPYVDALANHVPRALWPDKPQERLGNAFGKRYHILTADDERSSWNVCWTADLYITGGFRWALAGIFLIGLALGIGVRLISLHPDRAFSFGLFSATVFPLFYQESNFSVMTGSVLLVTIALLAAYWIARRIARPRGGDAAAASAA
jgi:hypothetical protein